MSNYHDLGLSDLQEPEETSYSRRGMPDGMGWTGMVVIAVLFVTGIVLLAMKFDDQDRSRAVDYRAECAEQGGKPIEVGHQGSCIVDGARAVTWWVP